MRSFFNEYGKTIIVSLVMMTLIVLGVALANGGTESMRNIAKGFLSQAQLESDGSGNGSSGSGLISFTINRTTYQAEEGMTWGEWVTSQYNTNPSDITGDKISEVGGFREMHYWDNMWWNYIVSRNDIIEENGGYGLGGDIHQIYRGATDEEEKELIRQLNPIQYINDNEHGWHAVDEYETDSQYITRILNPNMEVVNWIVDYMHDEHKCDIDLVDIYEVEDSDGLYDSALLKWHDIDVNPGDTITLIYFEGYDDDYLFDSEYYWFDETYIDEDGYLEIDISHPCTIYIAVNSVY